jgi:excisionase family DNA binding protein
MLFIGSTEVEIGGMEVTTESLDVIIQRRKTAWTVEGLAALLACSTKFIYKQVQAGKLPAFRLNSSIRLDPKSTATWLRSRSTI